MKELVSRFLSLISHLLSCFHLLSANIRKGDIFSREKNVAQIYGTKNEVAQYCYFISTRRRSLVALWQLLIHSLCNTMRHHAYKHGGIDALRPLLYKVRVVE
jgi:hypothetical protein